MATERNGKNAVTSFRSKYPGAYDKYSDKEMLDAIKKKHPGKYEDLTIEDSVAPTENVLQRAAKSAMSSFDTIRADQGDLGYSIAGGRNPLVDAAANAGMAMTGPKNNPFKFGDVGAQAEDKRLGAAKDLSGGNVWKEIGLGMVTDPRNIPGGGILGKSAAKNTMNTTKSIAGWFAEPWQNVSKINKFKSSGMADIAETALTEEAKAAKSGALRKQVVGKLHGDEPLSALAGEEAYLNKGIKNSSHQEALSLQEDLPKLYRDQSDKFGSDLKNLLGDKPVNVPAKEIQPSLERALSEHGILKMDEAGNLVPARAPITPTENKIFNMYRNFKQGLSDNPDITIDASDLLKSQESMRVPFGKSPKGSDMLKTTVRRHVSEVLEPHVPGLRELRSSHAPFLRGKYQSIKELNPFSNEYNTGKASGFLERYAKGALDNDEKNLVGFLEKELGRELNQTGKAMGNRLSQSASKQAQIKGSLKQALGDVDRAVEDSITAIKSKRITSEKELTQVVDEMIRKNNWDKWKKGGVGTVLLEITRRTVLGKLGNWYSKKPYE